MLNQNHPCFSSAIHGVKKFLATIPFLIAAVILIVGNSIQAQAPLRERLKTSSFKIAHETYTNGNWEIFVMNSDGSEPANLTNTPKEHEHYPQVSPDGTKICFSVDEGEGRDAVRSLWVMDVDGKNRTKLADHAREPFWKPDGDRKSVV